MTATLTGTGTSTSTVEERVERLSRASLKRIIDPDKELPGSVGNGQLIADELLSVNGIEGLELTAEQKRILSREEIASIADAGVRFEAVLTAGFALQITFTDTITDPRVVYLLHEIGEESRHSRLFIRVLEQIKPTASNPLSGKVLNFLLHRGIRRVITLPALLYTLVLAGEEIPDLFQKKCSEHPETDPFVAEVNRYHRMEEARHLSFARAVLPEVWAEASIVEKVAVRRVAPLVIKGMFETLVHPGVYTAAGLPGWETWKKVNRTPQRIALRHEALRPVLKALLDAGVFRKGHVPKGWQDLCGVDAAGAALAAA